MKIEAKTPLPEVLNEKYYALLWFEKNKKKTQHNNKFLSLFIFSFKVQLLFSHILNSKQKLC